MGEGWTGTLVTVLVDGRDVGEEAGSERIGWTVGGTGLVVFCAGADIVFVGRTRVAVGLVDSCELVDTVGLKNWIAPISNRGPRAWA